MFPLVEKKFRNYDLQSWFDDVVTDSQQSLSIALEQLAKQIVEKEQMKCTVYEVHQSLIFLKVMTESLRLFYPKVGKMLKVQDLTKMLNMMIANDEIKTTKIIKYYYCALCSIAYQSPELPEKPGGATIVNNRVLPFCGMAYKAAFRRLKKGDRRAVTFASTIFLCRYSATQVTSNFINSASEGYVQRITRVPVVKKYDIQSIKGAVRQMGGPISFEDLVCSTVKCVSVSATSEGIHCGGEHGQYGVIENVAPKISFSNELGQTYNGICPSPYFAYSLYDGDLKGTVTHLCEPLKVRSITTEGAWEFFAGKPIQDVLAKRMKKMENLCFGREVSEKDINELRLRSLEYYPNEELFFLSGDYESATDNLSPKLSRLVDYYIIESLGLNYEVPRDRKIAFSLWDTMARVYQYLLNGENLGPRSTKKHWLSVSSWFKESIERSNLDKRTVGSIRDDMWENRSVEIDRVTSETVIQTGGQMMGDIKSFPVLCIINLALWNLVNDNKVKRIKRVSECPLFGTRQISYVNVEPPCQINGDDFLAYAPKAVIEKWFRLVSEFDLKASIGKTYVSKTVAQINSTNFVLTGNGMQKVKALPLHAVFSIPTDRPVTQSINYAIEHNPELLNRLIFFNKERIREVTGGGLINLCLPIELGGLGVKAEPKSVTLRQLLIARHNSKSRNKLQLRFEWVPHRRVKRKKGGYKIEMHMSKPKGIGLTKDKFGTEHVLSTYNSTREARVVANDDWLANLSRQRFSGRRGRMIIKGDFYRKFAAISNKMVDEFQKSRDKRVPPLPTSWVIGEELAFHKYRVVADGYYQKGYLIDQKVPPTSDIIWDDDIGIDQSFLADFLPSLNGSIDDEEDLKFETGQKSEETEYGS